MSAKDEAGERRGLLPRYSLKDADIFMLADAIGDIHSADDGFFANDTRVLSRYSISIGGRQPSLLGAAINEDNTLFTAHLTNRPLPATGEHTTPKGVIHIERSRFLCGSRMYERIAFDNFSESAVTIPLVLSFAADFADIFEVQGIERPARGEDLAPRLEAQCVVLSYRGRDEVVRTTHLSFSRRPTSLSECEAQFTIAVPRAAREELYVEIGLEPDSTPSAARYHDAHLQAYTNVRKRFELSSDITTEAPLFNNWIARSRADLALLTTSLATGPYPYAGVPWFATQFGRDAIITALQSLWLNPSLAAGVVRFLASTQARETSSFQDAEPGKIMHEMRRGEMAALGEVPFGRYYGGVDTTPLFVMLAGAYESCTGDRTLADDVWPALLAATEWIERRLDSSPTGFLDYARGEDTGLSNQGWKDSHDSIFHADGRFPEGPIALVEVQGYAYAALKSMADLAAARGDKVRANALRLRAQRLREAIEDRFWVREMSYYAIALDGGGTPCQVYASNAGHLLFCGVPTPERAEAVSAHLVSTRSRSGWGIRTLAEGEPRYNPMSYHNGSIWPHDTAICSAGLSRYGERANVVQILNEIFDAANHFSMRLPELYCGFRRVVGQGPTPYPVACLPQAWAAGSIFMLLQAALGIRIAGADRTVHIDHPTLPIGIESLSISHLPVGSEFVDLHFRRVGDDVVTVPSKRTADNVRVLIHL